MKKSKKKPYFEEWYYRELSEKEAFAFTVRIDYDENGKMTGKLQVQMGEITKEFHYAHPVNMNLRGSLFLVLDKNVFTEVCIHLDLEEPGCSIKGDIYFEAETGRCSVSRKRKIWAMEQILSGELWVNGREVSFDGGKGYLEERRGWSEASQPRSFYTQCNWFGERAFRIVCGGSSGRNCFAVIDQDGYPIRLMPWKGARLDCVHRSGFRLRQGRYMLEGWRAEDPEPAMRYRLTHGGDVLFDEISRRAVYHIA